MTPFLSSRAEFRLGLPQRNRKPSLRRRLVGRSLLGKAVRAGAAAGAIGGGYALLRRRGGGLPAPAGAAAAAAAVPKPRSAKKLANSAKVARRRTAIGKPAKYVEGGLKGRTKAERQSAARRVKKAAAQARQRLGANYRTHYRLTQFSRFYR